MLFRQHVKSCIALPCIACHGRFRGSPFRIRTNRRSPSHSHQPRPWLPQALMSCLPYASEGESESTKCTQSNSDSNRGSRDYVENHTVKYYAYPRRKEELMESWTVDFEPINHRYRDSNDKLNFNRKSATLFSESRGTTGPSTDTPSHEPFDYYHLHHTKRYRLAPLSSHRPARKITLAGFRGPASIGTLVSTVTLLDSVRRPFLPLNRS